VVREGLQGVTRIDLSCVFFHKKIYIHSYSFYLSGSVNKFQNFCVAYFPCCFRKMAILLSHSHFFCCICVNYGFPNFWSIYLWHTDFSWNKVAVLTSQDHKRCAIRKSWGTTGLEAWVIKLVKV